MIQRPQVHVFYCYQRAAEEKLFAMRCSDPEGKSAHLEMERRWLTLASSYEKEAPRASRHVAEATLRSLETVA
jgi:hypothetical protein